MTNSKLQSLLQGSALIFLGNLVGAGSSFFARAVAAQYLGPNKYGIIVLGVTILHSASLVCLLGLPQGLAREIPRVNEKTDLFFTSIFFTIPASLLFGVVLSYSSDTLAMAFQAGELSRVIILFSFTLPFMVLFRNLLAALRGFENAIGRVLVQNFSYQIMTVLFLIIGVIIGVGTVGIAAAWSLSLLFACVVGLATLFKTTNLFNNGIPKMSIMYGERSKGLVVLSLPLLASEGLWKIVDHIDSFFLGYFYDSSSVGIYDSAYTLGQVLLLFLGTMSFLALPAFSRLHSNNNISGMDSIYKTSAKWLGILVFPMYSILVSYPDLVLSLTFGKEYTSGALALQIISTGFFINVAMGLNRPGILSLGMSKSILKGNFMAVILNVFLNIILIPIFGLVGAAAASAFSYVFANLYWVYILYSETKIHPLDREYFYSMLLLSIVSVLILGIVQMLTNGPEIAIITLFLCAYLVILAVFIPMEDEIIESLEKANNRIPVNISPLINILRRT